MMREAMLKMVAGLCLVASTAVGTTENATASSGGPRPQTASAHVDDHLYNVWYYDSGRWRAIGPLNWYDANSVLADLRRQGYRGYIAQLDR